MSLQAPNGDIYVVGGFNRIGKSNGFGAGAEVLRDCLRINTKLQVYQLERMETARYGAPLALVHDRFLLALGGFT